MSKTLDKIFIFIKKNFKASGSVDIAEAPEAGLDIAGTVEAVVGGLTKKGHKKHPKIPEEKPEEEDPEDDESEDVVANAKAAAEGMLPL